MQSVVIVAATVLLGIASQPVPAQQRADSRAEKPCPKGTVLVCFGEEATQVCVCEKFPP